MRFTDDPQARDAWTAILASEAPTTYRVSIGAASFRRDFDFEGIIENFYSQHELHKTFVAEGARECKPVPGTVPIPNETRPNQRQ